MQMMTKMVLEQSVVVSTEYERQAISTRYRAGVFKRVLHADLTVK
ncbi:hypothetical protein [Limosilactobacillus albertensis]